MSWPPPSFAPKSSRAAIRVELVHTRLAADRKPISRVGDEPALPLAEQAGRSQNASAGRSRRVSRAIFDRMISLRASSSLSRSRLGCITEWASKRNVPARSSRRLSGRREGG